MKYNKYISRVYIVEILPITKGSDFLKAINIAEGSFPVKGDSNSD